MQHLRTYQLAAASIATPEGDINTVLSKYTCVRENVVYAIKCCSYNKMYIGETGKRLGDRFREHLRSTLLPDTDIPLAAPLHPLVTGSATC